jgi:hypothetical protein
MLPRDIAAHSRRFSDLRGTDSRGAAGCNSQGREPLDRRKTGLIAPKGRHRVGWTSRCRRYAAAYYYGTSRGSRPRCYTQVGCQPWQPCPVGAFDNSPAIHRWDAKHQNPVHSPVGTIERLRRSWRSVVPTGLETSYPADLPSSELLGYFQLSLRDEIASRLV